MNSHPNYQSLSPAVQVMLEHHCETHTNCVSPIALYEDLLQQLETTPAHRVAQNLDLSWSLVQMIAQSPIKY